MSSSNLISAPTSLTPLCNPWKWKDALTHIDTTNPISTSILGSTGSIGKYALDIARAHPGRFKIVALCAAGSNIPGLIEQILEFKPELVSVESAAVATQLRNQFPRLQIELGTAGSIMAAQAGKLVVAAISGVAGLKSTITALQNDAVVALANKESIVCGASILAKIKSGTLIPVDSEHSSLAQLLLGVTDITHVQSLTLTASGGPFLERDISTFASITPAEAIRHPKWNMGAKISIDSSTLVNKALEWFEAVYLFGISKVEIVVHPQSIVHACVSLQDGATLANLSYPDMKLPIGFAMGVGDRIPGLVKPLDLARLGQLSFLPLDAERFPAIPLAARALSLGVFGTCLYSLANEVAVERFCAETLSYPEIVQFIAKALSLIPSAPIESTESVEDLIEQVRSIT